MAREATGELERLSDGRFAARVTIQGRTRRQFVLVTCSTEREAGERTRAMASMAARLRRAGLVSEIEKLLDMAAAARAGRPWDAVVAAVDALCAGGTEQAKGQAIPTFAAFAEEWTSARLAARHPDHVRAKDSDDDKSRLKLYINPHLGEMRLDQITLVDCDAVMSSLPDDLASATRRQVAQIIARVLRLAVYPGRYIAASPIPKGWLPRVGKGKARAFVYPDEDAALMACTRVPLWRRLLWGFMAREGTRGPSEALAFRFRHVDLERGAVRLDVNKTDDPRVWALTLGTARALRSWKKLRGEVEPSDLIFVDEDGRQPHETHLADLLRSDLKTALGERLRPELLEHSEHRIQLRAHDLRASYITVALANGRSETEVTDRTGHTTSGQLMNYRRAARTVSELHLGDWTPLDEAIPELRGLPADCPPGGSSRGESSDLGHTIEREFSIGARSAKSGSAFKSAASAVPPRGRAALVQR